MAANQPTREFRPVQFGGVWNEARNPSKIGGNGLTACLNNIYRRNGSWGKRSGSAPAYKAAIPGLVPTAPMSGIRWHASFPSALSQLVIAAQGALWSGGDPNTTTPSPLTQISPVTQYSASPVSFAPVRDPAHNLGAGADILIAVGASIPNASFAATQIVFGSSAAVVPGYIFTVTLTSGTHVVNLTYTVLPGDTPASVATAIAAAINGSSAVTPGSPFLGQAIPSSTGLGQLMSSQINLYALVGGGAGNTITVKLASSGSVVSGLSPLTTTNFTGGGLAYSGPLKYDGTTLTGLSGAITQAFTGCVSWHNHVWYWGDPNNPDILYASDINQPEGWAFMTQNGGYPIGVGDGDPAIQTCIPIGNIMYILKRTSIYAITGYDFQSGEYQFNVQPAVQGYGIPSPGCATTLNNALLFWSGAKFNRLAVGSFEPEHLGRPIPLTSGKVALGNQAVVRAVAGDFLVGTHLNDAYTSVGPVTSQELFTNLALFAVDVGNNAADTTLAYDDDASNEQLAYAWAPWQGQNWTIGAWIPFGNGTNAAQNGTDLPALYWISPKDALLTVYQFGADAGQDSSTAITWKAQTGWIDCGTPALIKGLHATYLDTEATPGMTMKALITAAGPVGGSAQTIYPPLSLTFPPSVGTANIEAAQILVARVNPFLSGFKFMFSFTESGSETSFELAGMLLDVLEEPFKP